MRGRDSSIIREARRIVKWNKKRFNRQFRHSQKYCEAGKGCQYKKNGYDSRMKTMA